MNVLNNRQDLRIYKQLLKVLQEYITAYPHSGLLEIFTGVCTTGIKSIPRDATALKILEEVLSRQAPAAVVANSLLHLKFSDVGLQEDVVWKSGQESSNKVLALINTTTNESGQWVTCSGRQVNPKEN